MSERFPGGFITQSPPVPTATSASGVWTLDQQEQLRQAGQWPVNGPFYIEEVFSTYLYTSGGNPRTITNDIDLAGKGGLVWIKKRSGGTDTDHKLVSTPNRTLVSNSTAAVDTDSSIVQQFNSNGFQLGDNSQVNSGSAFPYVSWTFRKQPKFFDVVTYTGDGVDPRNIAHNLGSVPGCMIIKCTSTGATGWFVYHRSLGNSQSLTLNEAVGAETGTQVWGTTTPTSTVFTVGNINANTNGRTYVAYLFAHDAGGFGLSGTENVVSCGAYTGSNSSAVTVNLGYEPQWVMIKRANGAGSPAWWIGDTMRGLNMQGINRLEAWASDAEGAAYNGINPTATGFDLPAGTVLNDSATSNYIYIAIRRGPMKVPTLGTSVFSPLARTGTGATATITGAGFPPDLVHIKARPYGSFDLNDYRNQSYTRLGTKLYTDGTEAEGSVTSLTSIDQNGYTVGNATTLNGSGVTFINYFFGRSSGFMDVVCYTGTGATQTQAHNLGAIPELMIFKQRTGTARSWGVYVAALGNANQLLLNSDSNVGAATTLLNSTSPTASIFTVGSSVLSNQNGSAIVAYLFATCAGVSKVGSYTGTGTTQAINCGFTAGARFVMIKRTDDVGDWYVWDSARGIVAGNDPYLLWNNGAPEVTGTDYVDTSATGFELTSTAPAAINASGGSYIFLAVA